MLSNAHLVDRCVGKMTLIKEKNRLISVHYQHWLNRDTLFWSWTLYQIIIMITEGVQIYLQFLKSKSTERWVVGWNTDSYWGNFSKSSTTNHMQQMYSEGLQSLHFFIIQDGDGNSGLALKIRMKKQKLINTE